MLSVSAQFRIGDFPNWPNALITFGRFTLKHGPSTSLLVARSSELTSANL
jgi:hypothetical protein